MANDKSNSVSGKWMLPTSFVLGILFVIPFSALAGLILATISLNNAKNKTWPIVAIAVNLVFGFLNFLWTQILIQQFFFS